MGVSPGSTGFPRWLLPLLVGLLIAFVSSFVWYRSQSHQQKTLEEAIRLRAGRIDVDLTRRSASLIDALVQLAESEQTNGQRVSDQTQALSTRTLNQFSSLSAIALVDSEYGLRWIQAKSTTALSLDDIQAAERACDRLLRRGVRDSMAVVDRGDLTTPGSGFVVGLPVRDSGHTRAFIVALFEYESFFSAMIGERTPAHGLQVLSGSRELYRSGDWRPDVSVAAETPLHFPGADWQVRLWQRPVSTPRPSAALMMLVLGLTLALVIGSKVHSSTTPD